MDQVLIKKEQKHIKIGSFFIMTRRRLLNDIKYYHIAFEVNIK